MSRGGGSDPTVSVRYFFGTAGDRACRAGRTFRFTEQGPVGLLKARRAWIVTASAGTAVGSEVDFNTTYLRTILGFIGVPEVRVIAAEMLQLHGESAVAQAFEAIDAAVASIASA